MANTEPAWTILTQGETTAADASGRYVSGVRVTFKTASGNIGSVFVPDSVYTPAKVREAVNMRYAQMEQVQNLTG